jgi:hypothetical protein
MTDTAVRLASPHEHAFLGDNHARNERRQLDFVGYTVS